MTTQAEKLIGTEHRVVRGLGSTPKRVLGFVIAISALAAIMGGECWVLEHGPTALGALQWALATDLTPLLDHSHWHFSLQTAAVH